jgi:bifunctional non-homologous end joining protein LigD
MNSARALAARAWHPNDLSLPLLDDEFETDACLAKTSPGLRLNEHLDHEDGEIVFRHACKLGLEGIVSKRLGSPSRSGRSPDWRSNVSGKRRRTGGR